MTINLHKRFQRKNRFVFTLYFSRSTPLMFKSIKNETLREAIHPRE